MGVEIPLSDLVVTKEHDGYVLQQGGLPIRTPGGLPIRANNAELLRHLAKEFEMLGHAAVTLQDHAIRAPRFLGAYTLLSTQLEFVETAKVPTSDIRSWAADDPSIPVLRATAQDQPEFAVKALARLEELGVSALPATGTGMNLNAYLARVTEEWEKLRPCDKSIVVNLYSVHEGILLFAILLATGHFTTEDYATGVLIRDLLAHSLADTSKEGRQSRVAELQDDAQACITYRQFWS
jgi:hypothetical protein